VRTVDLCLVEPGFLSHAAGVQRSIFRVTEGREVPLDSLSERSEYTLVLDAVLGYSLRGAPIGAASEAIHWMTASDARILSLDIPSGLDADTGHAPGLHVTAEATLTLHLPKPGLTNPAAGKLWLADLGIPAAITCEAGAEPAWFGQEFVVPVERIPGASLR
jgi:NAD(P)H-hydrate epimerase